MSQSAENGAVPNQPTIVVVGGGGAEGGRDEVPRVRPMPAKPVDPSRMVGPDGIKPEVRVTSPDYGEGRILGLSALGVTVYWNTALKGTHTHVMEHDRSFVEDLERLP